MERRRSAEISALYRDRDDTLWVGTFDGVFHVKGGKSTRFSTRDGLSSQAVRYITQDPDGVMWIGMESGLAKYERGVFKAYTFEALGPAPELLTFLKDREGSVWVGSRSLGLARLRASHFTSVLAGERTARRERRLRVPAIVRHHVGRHQAGSGGVPGWTVSTSRRKERAACKDRVFDHRGSRRAPVDRRPARPVSIHAPGILFSTFLRRAVHRDEARREPRRPEQGRRCRPCGHDLGGYRFRRAPRL